MSQSTQKKKQQSGPFTYTDRAAGSDTATLSVRTHTYTHIHTHAHTHTHNVLGTTHNPLQMVTKETHLSKRSMLDDGCTRSWTNDRNDITSLTSRLINACTDTGQGSHDRGTSPFQQHVNEDDSKPPAIASSSVVS